MNFKYILIWCGKAIVGGIIAVAVLTCFCCFYWNTPLPYFNQQGRTEYLMSPDTFYIQGVEGFGWGKTNNEGFLESMDYQENMPVDILIMGGSQVEGFQVRQSETMTAVLDDLMPNKIIYNIGLTSHLFLISCGNLEAALDYYMPSDAVIVEVNEIDYSTEELLKCVKGDFPEIPKSDHGKLYKLMSRNRFLRLFKQQLTDYFELMEEKKVRFSRTADHAVTEDPRYVEALDNLFEKLANLCEQYETALILFYHPETQLDQDGSLLFDTDPDALRAFREGCERHGITFIDMTDSFTRLYEEEHRLPYGFANSQAGKGHFNAAGHRLVAEELYTAIRSLEGEEE